MESTQQLPRIGEVLSVSYKAAVSNFGTFMKVVLPYVVIVALQSILQVVWFNIAINILLTIVVIAVGIWMTILLYRVSYQATINGKADLAAAQKDWAKVIFPGIIVSALTGIIIGFGFILLVVPGIILAMMYFASPYLVIIDGKKIGEALSQSIQLSKGHKWDLFVKLFVSYIIVAIPTGIAATIVMLVLGSVGNLFSETVAQLLMIIGVFLIMLPVIPMCTNIETFLFGHLKELGGM